MRDDDDGRELSCVTDNAHARHYCKLVALRRAGSSHRVQDKMPPDKMSPTVEFVFIFF